LILGFRAVDAADELRPVAVVRRSTADGAELKHLEEDVEVAAGSCELLERLDGVGEVVSLGAAHEQGFHAAEGSVVSSWPGPTASSPPTTTSSSPRSPPRRAGSGTRVSALPTFSKASTPGMRQGSPPPSVWRRGSPPLPTHAWGEVLRRRERAGGSRRHRSGVKGGHCWALIEGAPPAPVHCVVDGAAAPMPSAASGEEDNLGNYCRLAWTPGCWCNYCRNYAR
jgi:hypothetical protein